MKTKTEKVISFMTRATILVILVAVMLFGVVWIKDLLIELFSTRVMLP